MTQSPGYSALRMLLRLTYTPASLSGKDQTYI
jgi:hypothetical protein